MFSHQRFPLLLPLVPALTGLALSVWNVTDTGSVPCPTAGCLIQTAFTIGGVSLWWPGVLLFALLSVCAMIGQRQAGRCLAGLALLADLPLLLLMLISAPCFACMIVALCIALTFIAFREPAASWSARPQNTLFSRMLLLIWSLLFTATVGLLINESVKPWAISSPTGQASASVYFSFDCSACRKLIFSMSPDMAETMAWYPVAENAGDATAAIAMARALKNGLPMADALREARAAGSSPSYQRLAPSWWMMQIRLWINRSHVLLAGQDTLPMVEFYGIPDAMLNHPRAQRPLADMPEADLPFLNLENAGACTGSKLPGQDCLPEEEALSKTP